MKVMMLVLNTFIYDARVFRAARALTQEGHEVAVVALWEKGLKLQEQRGEFHIVRLPLITKPWPKHPLIQGIKYIEFVIRAFWYGRKIKPQVIHANDLNTLLPAYLVKLIHGSKLIYDSHELCLETESMRKRPRSEQIIWRKLERWLIRKADAVITVSPGIAEKLKKNYKVDSLVIYNSPDLESLDGTSVNLKKVLKLSDQDILIVYEGAISAGRGLEQALEVLSLLPHRYHLACLGPVSTPKFLEHLKIQAKALNVSDRFHWVPPVSHTILVPTIASADLGIHLAPPNCLSYKLAAANKFFDYMAAGLPILYISSSHVAQIIGEAGISCDLNPQIIADAILHLFSNPEQLQALREAGLKRYREHYSWEKQRRKLLSIYKQLG